MKGHQLKTLREERNLTQSQLAEFLGDTTPGTVSKWEKDVHAIPQWVSDKMLTSAAVTLPLEALRNLLNYAAEQGITFEELLAQAIRAYTKPKPDKITPITSYIDQTPPLPESKVAEEPPGN